MYSPTFSYLSLWFLCIHLLRSSSVMESIKIARLPLFTNPDLKQSIIIPTNSPISSTLVLSDACPLIFFTRNSQNLPTLTSDSTDSVETTQTHLTSISTCEELSDNPLHFALTLGRMSIATSTYSRWFLSSEWNSTPSISSTSLLSSPYFAIEYLQPLSTTVSQPLQSQRRMYLERSRVVGRLVLMLKQLSMLQHRSSIVSQLKLFMESRHFFSSQYCEWPCSCFMTQEITSFHSSTPFALLMPLLREMNLS